MYKKELQLIGGVWAAVIRTKHGKVAAAKDFSTKDDAVEWMDNWLKGQQ